MEEIFFSKREQVRLQEDGQDPLFCVGTPVQTEKSPPCNLVWDKCTGCYSLGNFKYFGVLKVCGFGQAREDSFSGM